MQTMKSSVVYFSRGGKTRKVAEAVAQELGCKSVDITKETPDLSGVDMLLVGSGNYVGKTDPKLLTFLNNLQPSSDKKAAVFATSGGPDPKVFLSFKRLWKRRATKSFPASSAVVNSFFPIEAIQMRMT